jgi:hypothetical protein
MRAMAPMLLKVCYIRPEGGRPGATPRRPGDVVAAAERVDNVRVTPLLDPAAGRPRAAVERFKLWQNARTLKAKFLDGVPAVQEKVASIATEWEEVVNLTIQFVKSGSAEIRISFKEQGFSWSTVGTDALTVGASEPTMNYGWLEPDTELTEYQRVVRHEFGHAMGMIHEHQNPDAKGKIPWDNPKVYAYYAEQGWSKADVDSNIFDVYDTNTTNFTMFDPTSIMEYAIPNELTIGDYEVGWNTELSAQDVSFMRSQYPQADPGVIELTVGAPATAAAIGSGGEVDTYHFDVATAVTHVMTTTGALDTVLTLHGPHDPGTVVAWDDDHGQGRNARIVRRLEPGSYWLSVRHKEPGGTGDYRIRVTTRKS